jgi:hypothetical protein
MSTTGGSISAKQGTRLLHFAFAANPRDAGFLLRAGSDLSIKSTSRFPQAEHLSRLYLFLIPGTPNPHRFLMGRALCGRQ